MAGKEAEAERMYQAAQDWFAQGEQREVLARAAHGIGWAHWRQDKRTEAHAAFEQSIALLENQSCAKLVEVLADLSVLLTVYIGLQEEGIASGQQALMMAHELGDVNLETREQRIVAGNLASLRGDDLCSAIQFVEQVLVRTEADGDLAGAAECCFNLAVAYYWMAEITRSQASSAHLLKHVERCRQLYHLRTAYTWRVLLFASQGGWAEAERVIAQAHPVVDALGQPYPLSLPASISRLSGLSAGRLSGSRARIAERPGGPEPAERAGRYHDLPGPARPGASNHGQRGGSYVHSAGRGAPCRPARRYSADCPAHDLSRAYRHDPR